MTWKVPHLPHLKVSYDDQINRKENLWGKGRDKMMKWITNLGEQRDTAGQNGTKRDVAPPTDLTKQVLSNF